MPGAKRVLLFLAELAFLCVGVGLSVALFSVFVWRWEATGYILFWAGMLATYVAFLRFRRRNRAWKVEYDAAVYVEASANRKLHPRRTRIERQILVWVPSAIAAFAFLYFPQATHMMRPRAGHFKHYWVPVPWKFPIFSHEDEILVSGTTGQEGWFGTTRSWNFKPMTAEMNFGSIDPDRYPFDFKLEYGSANRALPGPTIQEFTFGEVTLTCWASPYGYRYQDPRAYWYVHCQTPIGERARNFYAEFAGERVDLPAFYDILRGVRLVQFAK